MLSLLTTSFYYTGWQAIMAVLQKLLVDSWTNETAKAWTELWDVSAAAMMKVCTKNFIGGKRACCYPSEVHQSLTLLYFPHSFCTMSSHI